MRLDKRTRNATGKKKTDTSKTLTQLTKSYIDHNMISVAYNIYNSE